MPVNAKERAHAAIRGGYEGRPRNDSRQGDCTGSRAKNAQGLEESVGPGSNRAEGETRATPLPRTNRAPARKNLTQKNPAASDDATQTAEKRCLRSCLLYTSPSPRDRTRYRMPS